MTYTPNGRRTHGSCVRPHRRGSELLREVAWVVFDEVHYMQDRERGVVWEESIIFLPKDIHMVRAPRSVPVGPFEPFDPFEPVESRAERFVVLCPTAHAAAHLPCGAASAVYQTQLALLDRCFCRRHWPTRASLRRGWRRCTRSRATWCTRTTGRRRCSITHSPLAATASTRCGFVEA